MRLRRKGTCGKPVDVIEFLLCGGDGDFTEEEVADFTAQMKAEGMTKQLEAWLNERREFLVRRNDETRRFPPCPPTKDPAATAPQRTHLQTALVIETPAFEAAGRQRITTS